MVGHPPASAPRLSCTSLAPPALPCLRPRGSSQGEGQEDPSLATLHDPLSPPDTQTVLLRLQLDRGDSGL